MDVEFLRSVSILRHLTEEELQSFCPLFFSRDIKPKERIIEEGTEVKAFSIIREGIVYVRRMANKREMLLGRLGPGGFFGEINLFDPGTATASLYAMKPTRLLSISYEDFHRYMDEHPATGYKIASAMMKELARRLRLTSARLAGSAYWENAEAALPRVTPRGKLIVPASESLAASE